MASATDPYMDLARARTLAAAWGADFIDAGDAGHINSASGLGCWAAGHALLERLALRG